MSGEKDMQDGSVRVRWFTFDVPQLIALGSILAAGVTGYATLKSEVSNLKETNAERGVIIDHRMNNVEEAAKSLPTMTHRLTSVEQQILATNQRLDRFIELLNNNIELIRKDINNLTIEFRVLSTEVKQQNSAAKNDRAVNH